MLSYCRRSILSRSVYKADLRIYQGYKIRRYCTSDGEEESSSNLPSVYRFPVNQSGISIISKSNINSGLATSMELPRSAYPGIVPMIPLTNPFLPGLTVGINVSSKNALTLLQLERENSKNYIATFLQQSDNMKEQKAKDKGLIHRIGTLSEIKDVSKTVQDSSWSARYPSTKQLIVTPVGRIRLVDTEPNQFSFKNTDLLYVKVEPLLNIDYDPTAVESQYYRSEILACISKLSELSGDHRRQFAHINTVNPKDLSELADTAAFLSTTSSSTLQELLEETNVIKRAQKSLQLLKKEAQVISIRFDLQLKQMQNLFKLNADNGKSKNSIDDRWKERMEKFRPPEYVMEVIKDEMERFSTTPSSSADHGTIRNYLDWLTQIPWNYYTKDNFDLDLAEKLLNDTHHGIKDVKERVLEFIAVGALKQKIEDATSQGKILCLIGFPGVGKTSIGKSIATALNRKFERIAVGGMSDVSEIKGHRRTYVGSLPGKLVRALKQAGTMNPVIVIDEIEKLKSSHDGDPSAALLEALDPEQNSQFMDNYLDVPIDLSRVLFICTGNSASQIPGPLLDRMELIEVPGYTTYEKKAIAEDYLIPKVAEETGLSPDSVQFPNNIINSLIDEYCRDPGVRILKQKIESLFRQAAVDIVQKKSDKLILSKDNMRTLLGRPSFSITEAFKSSPPGVVAGLGYTDYGGNILLLETIAHPSKGKSSSETKLTGNTGNVLSESARIAEIYAKVILQKYEPDHKDFFSKHNVNIHFPNGAVKKEGPSAGIALVTALVSLATGKPVDSKLGMTGEITLTGKIIGVGGVKTKLLAAQRSGIKKVCLPEENKFDYDELDDVLKETFEEVKFFSHYPELYQYLFQNSENLKE